MTAEIERCPHCRLRSIEFNGNGNYAQFLGEYWAWKSPGDLEKYIRALKHMHAAIPIDLGGGIRDRWDVKSFIDGLERGRDEFQKGSAAHG